MAYDKVIDSTQLEAAITATANAIREKSGDAALIQWLADKGFAEAVAAIEAGGGGESIVYGSYTPATNTTFYQIQHNLGRTPEIVAIVGDTVPLKSPNYAVTGAWAANNINLKLFFSSNANGSYAIASSTTVSMTEPYDRVINKSSTFFNANNNTVDFGATGVSSQILVAGVTYHWFIM